MTTKRASKSKPRAGNAPKLKKETLRDLAAKPLDAEKVKGGPTTGWGILPGGGGRCCRSHG